jgi:predicted transcriptional regulator
MARWESHVCSALIALTNEVRDLKKAIDDLAELVRLRYMSPKFYKKSEIFDLPRHYQRTVLTVANIGEACTEEIAHITGVHRADESMYCNSLVILGWLEWRKDGRRKLFRISKEKEAIVSKYFEKRKDGNTK